MKDRILLKVNQEQYATIIRALKEYKGFWSDIAFNLVIRLEKEREEQTTTEKIVRKLFYEQYFVLIKEKGITFSLRIISLRKRCLSILKKDYSIFLSDVEWDNIIREIPFDTCNYHIDFGKAMSRRKGDFVRHNSAYCFVTIRPKNLDYLINKEE